MLSRKLLTNLYNLDEAAANLSIAIRMQVPMIDAPALPPPPPLQRQRRYNPTPLNEASRVADQLLNRRPRMRAILTYWAAATVRHLPYKIKEDILVLKVFLATYMQPASADVALVFLLRELERLVGDPSKTANLHLAIRQLILDESQRLMGDFGEQNAWIVRDAAKYLGGKEDIDSNYYKRMLENVLAPEMYDWAVGVHVKVAEAFPVFKIDLQIAIAAATQRILLEDEFYREMRRFVTFARELHRRLPLIQMYFQAGDGEALTIRYLDNFLLLSDNLEETTAAAQTAGIYPLVLPWR